MKKLRNALLLAGVLAALLCVTALAESQSLAGGFYVTGKAANVTVTPQTATGEKVSSTSADVDNQEEGYESFYPGAVKMAVTYNGSVASGENYVVLLVEGNALPTVDNAIYYIDQTTTASTGSITFNVYPMDIAGQKDLTLYITSDKAGFETIAIPMGYAPSGSYDVQPYTLGDVNQDQTIDIKDATMILNHVVGNTELTSTKFLAADVVKDDVVDVKDATKILNLVVGNITSLD
jgi:hypothetical protein